MIEKKFASFYSPAANFARIVGLGICPKHVTRRFACPLVTERLISGLCGYV